MCVRIYVFITVFFLFWKSLFAQEDPFCGSFKSQIQSTYLTASREATSLAVLCDCDCTTEENELVIIDWSGEDNRARVVCSINSLWFYEISDIYTNGYKELIVFNKTTAEEHGAYTSDTLIYKNGSYVPKNVASIKDAVFNAQRIIKPYMWSAIKENGGKSGAKAISLEPLFLAHDSSIVLYKAKKFTEAASLLDKSLASKKDLRTREVADIVNDCGYFFQMAGKYEKAVAILTKLLNDVPARTPAYLNLADAYQGLGKMAEAQENYRKYIELMKQEGKEKKIPKRVFDAVQ